MVRKIAEDTNVNNWRESEAIAGVQILDSAPSVEILDSAPHRACESEKLRKGTSIVEMKITGQYCTVFGLALTVASSSRVYCQIIRGADAQQQAL